MIGFLGAGKTYIAANRENKRIAVTMSEVNIDASLINAESVQALPHTILLRWGKWLE